MRKLMFALLAAVSFTVFASPSSTVTLAVQNMTCKLCAITLKKSLEKVAGVSSVEVDYTRKTAKVVYDPAKAQPQTLTQATTNAGFPSTIKE